MSALPDFKVLHAEQHARLGDVGAAHLLEAGRRWRLAPVLEAGGALLFPHTSAAVCGHQIAAVVHAVLDAGARQVLALGVLHGLSPELADARRRVAAGGDPANEPAWGVQGPGLDARQDWRREFSLDHFAWLLAAEAARRDVPAPALVARFPFLAGVAPERMPGFDELASLVSEPGTVLVATGDLVHHGHGYGDTAPLAPGDGGLAMAAARIDAGFALLAAGDRAGYQEHCVRTKSDARDVGPVLRELLGPCRWRVHDLVTDDMSGPYQATPPTWVAGALVEFTRDPARAGGEDRR
ncbi:hypothetical protein KDL67_09075 [bacterium]|nr:hypothetical protein [bacterium]